MSNCGKGICRFSIHRNRLIQRVQSPFSPPQWWWSGGWYGEKARRLLPKSIPSRAGRQRVSSSLESLMVTSSAQMSLSQRLERTMRSKSGLSLLKSLDFGLSSTACPHPNLDVFEIISFRRRSLLRMYSARLLLCFPYSTLIIARCALSCRFFTHGRRQQLLVGSESQSQPRLSGSSSESQIDRGRFELGNWATRSWLLRQAGRINGQYA